MKKILPLIMLFASFSAFGVCQQPSNGGTGVCNNNANIISLGGPILTSGAFTLSGAFSTTIIVSANSVVTFPSGTHTLASNDGSNASGTWGISITGTAAGGASPTGAASGDLTNNYPNPKIANNVVVSSGFSNTSFGLNVTNSTYSACSDYNIAGTNYWCAGIYPVNVGGEYAIVNVAGGTIPFYIDPSTSLIAISTLSNSQLVGTNGTKQLVSVNLSGDVATSGGFSTILATVNGSPGTTGSSSVVPIITYNGKGLVTSVSSATITPSAIGAPTTTGTGASGTWGINVTGNAGTVTTNANLTGPVTSVGNATTVTAASITNAMLAGSIDLTAKVSNTLPFSNGGFGFATATFGDLFYASALNTPGKLSDVAVNQVLTSGGVGAAPAYSASPNLTGLNLSGLTASGLVATDSSKNLSSSVSGLSPTFSGLSLSSTTPTNLTITDTTTGSANVASVNIFRGDVANGNSTVNYGTGSTSTWFVGLASTANGFTANAKDFVWRANSGDGGLGNVLFFGQTTADVTLPQGNLIVGLVNKGITIKSAAVSAGTANAAIITSVTLSGGTVTINDSYVTTSTVCFFSVVTPGGTPGTAYGVTVAAGTVKVTSTSALDATAGNLGCLKGN